MAKVSLTAGAVMLSNTVDAAAVADITAFAIAHYKAADGSDQTAALAVKDMLRSTYRGILANVRRWKTEQLHKAVVDAADIASTED